MLISHKNVSHITEEIIVNCNKCGNVINCKHDYFAENDDGESVICESCHNHIDGAIEKRITFKRFQCVECGNITDETQFDCPVCWGDLEVKTIVKKK